MNAAVAAAAIVGGLLVLSASGKKGHDCGCGCGGKGGPGSCQDHGPVLNPDLFRTAWTPEWLLPGGRVGNPLQRNVPSGGAMVTYSHLQPRAYELTAYVSDGTGL